MGYWVLVGDEMGRCKATDGAMLREIIYYRDAGRCQFCLNETTLESCEIHHMIPACYGGRDDSRNLITLCHPCHAKETADLFESIKLDKEFEQTHRDIISRTLSSAFLPSISKAAYKILRHEIREFVEHGVAVQPTIVKQLPKTIVTTSTHSQSFRDEIAQMRADLRTTHGEIKKTLRQQEAILGECTIEATESITDTSTSNPDVENALQSAIDMHSRLDKTELVINALCARAGLPGCKSGMNPYAKSNAHSKWDIGYS